MLPASARRGPPRRTSSSDVPVPGVGRLVVGLQPVREAVRVHGARLERLAVDRKTTPRLDALTRFAADQGVGRIDRVDRADLDRIAGNTSHQGVAAWAPDLELSSLEALLATPDLLAVALDAIQDPQNFGAVVRSAVALADAPILWAEHSSAPLSPATFRASAGAIEHARLCRTASLVDALRQARAQGTRVVGLDGRADVMLSDLDLTTPTILVVGSEHEGLGRAVRRACSDFARLVSPGRIESLNASVAAAVALYEAAKQRCLSVS